MAYKILIGICAACFLFSHLPAFGQMDSVVVLRRNGIDTKFTYRKYRTRSELQEVKFPHFGTARSNISRISALLVEFTQMETQYNGLVKAQHDLDSLHLVKETKLAETITLEKERADNFAKANKDLTAQYNALDGTL